MSKNTHIRKLFVLIGIFFLFLSSYKVKGQDEDYHFFENIDLGTEASVACCLVQDAQGMVWIGSDRGLLSYDGYSVQPHYTLGDKSDVRISCALKADDTCFFIATYGEVYIYNCKTDSYEYLGENTPTNIRTMVMCDGYLWLGTKEGLFRYEPDTQCFTAVMIDLPHQSVNNLLSTEDNCLYIGTYNGYCRYIPDSGQVERITLPMPQNKSNLYIISQLEDSARECIWIGTEGSLLKYSPSTSQVQQIDELRGNSVKSLVLDSHGRLLAGTDNGLYVYDESAPVQHIVHDSRDPHSLGNNVIWGIFTGQGRDVWFCTNSGLSLAYSDDDLQHISVSQITGVGEGNSFHSILRDGEGGLWFGGTDGILHFDNAGSENPNINCKWNVASWYRVGDKNFPLPHNQVHKLFEDSDGNLWVASDGGVGVFDKRIKQFTFYNIVDSTGQYNANWAYSFIEDIQGQLWIATCLGGIFVVDRQALMRTPAGGTFVAERVFTTQDGLSGMFPYAFARDHEGNVWALFYDSAHTVEKINSLTGEISHINLAELQRKGVPNSIMCAQDGKILVGCPEGIILVNPSDDSTEAIPFDSFDDFMVLAMTQAEGHIWISTSHGLWETDEQVLELHRLSVADESSTALYYDTVEKLMYMGVADGFIISGTEELLREQIEKPLVFTAFLVDNKPFDLSQSIRYTNKIVLHHKNNSLTFEVSDLSYSGKWKSRILYRLEKTDKEWNYLPLGTNRISYSNLKCGRYRLIVTQSDKFDKPLEKTYSMSIHIRPPFYFTPFAICIYVLAFVALGLWTIQFFRVRNRLKSESMEMEQLQSMLQAETEKHLEDALTEANEQDAVSLDEKFLANVLSLIEEHISDCDLNVNALCEWTDTTNKQMYRKIKRLTGMTPVVYIRSIRMKKAAMLLKQHKFTISEVMYMVGFSNHSYFSKCFYDEFGVTPKQYV